MQLLFAHAGHDHGHSEGNTTMLVIGIIILVLIFGAIFYLTNRKSPVAETEPTNEKE